MSTPNWLNDAIFYEIYPQSFMDTNADGIGDLQGIIKKLDYIKSLGANAIWLNPCFESPFQDAGYDVSDFLKVAPRYGTNEDLWELIDKAHQKGLKLILDLVAGHTSIEHPFFKASCQAEVNKYSNYFVWSNSWGSENSKYRFINGYAEREGNFMINFFYCQPALNYGFSEPEAPWEKRPEHPDCVAVREMMLDVMKFYLNHGCDGFRVDMASSLVKGKNNAEDLKKLWHYYRDEVRKVNSEAILVAEWSSPIEAVNAGFDVDFMVHFNHPGYTTMFRMEPARVPNSPFASEIEHSFFDKNSSGNSKTFNDEIVKNLKAINGKGLFSIPTGNHDIGRIRQFRSFEELKAVYACIFTLPGVPFLYYGDEIGMDYVYDLKSKEGGYNRTGARTPMQWSNTKNGGFSTASKELLYLPIDENNLSINNVAHQENEESSLFNFTRKLIEIRQSNEALGNYGEYTEIFSSSNKCPYIYLRSSNSQKVICGFNPSNQKTSLVLDNSLKIKNQKNILSSQAHLTINEDKLNFEMQENSYFIIEVE